MSALPVSAPLEDVKPNEIDVLLCTASEWQGHPRRCRWCNAELPGRRLRWCTDECGEAWAANHHWGTASGKAVERDGRACVRCGARPGDERRRPGTYTLVVLEVHHTTPCIGRHSQSGCHHHLDGLETLCCDCHLDEHHGAPGPEQMALEESA